MFPDLLALFDKAERGRGWG